MPYTLYSASSMATCGKIPDRAVDSDVSVQSGAKLVSHCVRLGCGQDARGRAGRCVAIDSSAPGSALGRPNSTNNAHA